MIVLRVPLTSFITSKTLKLKAERKAKKKTKKVGPVLCFDGGGIEPLLLGRVVKLFAESVKPQI